MSFGDDGTIWAWGDGTYGEMGDGQLTSAKIPQQVPGLDSVIAISAGGRFALAMRSDGGVWAWGVNGSGQIGDGTLDTRNVPTKISEAGFNWKTSTPRVNPGTGTYTASTTVTLTSPSLTGCPSLITMSFFGRPGGFC